jgi:hypothetical protein
MIVAALAVGVPNWPDPSGRFDWKPLLLVLVVLVLARFFVGLAMTWATAGAAFVIGTMWGWLIEAWGILPPSAFVLVLVITASAVVDRSSS